MKTVKIILACLLISGFVLAAQNFGFGNHYTVSNNAGLSGLTFDIPSKGNWDSQLVVSLNSAMTSSYRVGLKVNRDMGRVYNIKRFLGIGLGMWQDWSQQFRAGGQVQVGIKIPTFVEGFGFNFEVGFALSSNKTGRLYGGAFFGGGSSYSF